MLVTDEVHERRVFVLVVKFAISIAALALLGFVAIVLLKRQESKLSERCARVLVAAAKSVPTQASVSQSGPEVSVGGRQVRLRARVENRKHAENKFFVALAVDLYVDGVLQPLTVGSVGVGDTDQEAEDTAVEEWAQLVGDAVVAALASNNDAGLPFDGFVAYAGRTGIRGSQPNLPKDIAKHLLRQMKTKASNLRWSEGELHSISIIVKVNQGGTADGECRVDGVVSPEALTAMQAFPWPPTQALYMLKQFYILRRE